MAEVPLFTSASATFDALGGARIEMGPQVYGHNWRVNRMVVSTTSALTTTVQIFVNSTLPSALVSGSYNGNQDFDDAEITLQTLDRFIAVWAGGTPGAIATLQVQGIVVARGR